METNNRLKPVVFELPVDDAAKARTAKGQAAVDRILSAAIELLAHEGCAALSMRRVADRLNMRISAVQHHFSTWEDLLEAMIRRVTAGYVEATNRILSEPQSSRLKQFEHVLDYLFSDIKSPVSQSLFAQLWALAQTNEYARKAMISTYAHERAMFEFFIGELNPGLARKDIAQRAAMIATQIEGLMLLMPQQPRFPADLSGLEQVVKAHIIALVHAPATPVRKNART
jgi:AcrR family transcriptional regulator